MTNWKWRDVASVKIKLKVPATQHHRHKRPAPAHWRAVSNVRYLFGLALYFSKFYDYRLGFSSGVTVNWDIKL